MYALLTFLAALTMWGVASLLACFSGDGISAGSFSFWFWSLRSSRASSWSVLCNPFSWRGPDLDHDSLLYRCRRRCAFTEARPLRMLILFAVVGLNLWALADYYTSYKKESWDKAAAYVAGNAANGDVILIHKNYVKLSFNYYFQKYEKNVPQFPLPNDAAEREALIRALPPHQRIWLVGINVFLFAATSGAQKTSTQKP